VKIVVQAALKVWIASLGLLVVLGVVAGFTHLGETYRQGLARGGLLTVLLLGAVVLFALLAFGVIFVAFHEVFFAPGTWTFLFSDTLIRMYPEFFWRMAFFAVGLLAGLPGLALWYFLRR
jgi:uncharacterized membrane protein